MDKNGRYFSGKIYRVIDKDYTKCYIGSTCEKYLSNRLSKHRWQYKKSLNGEIDRNISLWSLFNEFGTDNCKIELIEDYPCNNKQELLKREGYFIKSTDCINKRVAGRKGKEYYQDNIDKIKEYHDQNKEHKQEYMKKYRQDNKEKLREQVKTYHEKNKDTINQKKREYWHNNREELTQKQRDKYHQKKEANKS